MCLLSTGEPGLRLREGSHAAQNPIEGGAPNRVAQAQRGQKMESHVVLHAIPAAVANGGVADASELPGLHENPGMRLEPVFGLDARAPRQRTRRTGR